MIIYSVVHSIGVLFIIVHMHVCMSVAKMAAIENCGTVLNFFLS